MADYYLIKNCEAPPCPICLVKMQTWGRPEGIAWHRCNNCVYEEEFSLELLEDRHDA